MIADSFVHPVLDPSEASLFKLEPQLIEKNLRDVEARMQELNISRSLVHLFNGSSLNGSQNINLKTIYFSRLASLENNNFVDALSEQHHPCLSAIVFHPYLQNIIREKWPAALLIAKEAERLRMPIFICTAIGSCKIYDIDVLPFATFIAGSVSSPVVFAHGGGVKVLEAMLVADAYPNVLLDTSFSLSYWNGSSVENDFAYAMRKIGSDRWLFGSDAPFIPLETALKDHFSFFEHNKFSDKEIESIMSMNFVKLFD